MAAFPNEGIHSITMDIPNIKVRSSIKRSVITLNFEVLFLPDQVIPDYCEIDSWIAENIKDTEMTIEAATLLLTNHLNSLYNPYHVQVNTKVTDAAHFPVTVTAES